MVIKTLKYDKVMITLGKLNSTQMGFRLEHSMYVCMVYVAYRYVNFSEHFRSSSSV